MVEKGLQVSLHDKQPFLYYNFLNNKILVIVNGEVKEILNMKTITLHPKEALQQMEYEDLDKLEDQLFNYYLVVKSIRNMKHCLKTINYDK